MVVLIRTLNGGLTCQLVVVLAGTHFRLELVLLHADRAPQSTFPLGDVNLNFSERFSARSHRAPQQRVCLS